MYPVTWTTAYWLPSLDGPSVFRCLALTVCEAVIGSTCICPIFIRMIKPRREPIHIRMEAVHTENTCHTPNITQPEHNVIFF